VAGTALEELVYRRLIPRKDEENDEPIGSVPGTTTWVTADDGTKLYTRTYGSPDAKNAIVFAHGITENHVIWHYLLRDLRADGKYRLVAYDARGHGNSGPARGPHGTTPFNGDTLGRDLAAVVEQTTTGPVVLVGHSLGGMTALTQLILERQDAPTGAPPYRCERVAGAVIVNSTFTAELAGWRGRGKKRERSFERANDVVRRLAGDDAKRIDRLRLGVSDLTILAARALFGRNASPRHVAVAFHMFETTSAQTLAAAIDMATYDVLADLPKVDVPTLIVTGSRDILTPPFLSREMTKQIPDAELVVFEGCGHMAPFERHDELTAQVRKFADEVFA
jgi:pimeloyl-ACP methyl ester carboxylesterase